MAKHDAQNVDGSDIGAVFNSTNGLIKLLLVIVFGAASSIPTTLLSPVRGLGKGLSKGLSENGVTGGVIGALKGTVDGLATGRILGTGSYQKIMLS